jgi:hypothetical protein
VWTWRGLVTFYTVFVIELASRRVRIFGSTPYPDGVIYGASRADVGDGGGCDGAHATRPHLRSRPEVER